MRFVTENFAFLRWIYTAARLTPPEPQKPHNFFLAVAPAARTHLAKKDSRKTQVFADRAESRK
jgi:hypothetical protein